MALRALGVAALAALLAWLALPLFRPQRMGSAQARHLIFEALAPDARRRDAARNDLIVNSSVVVPEINRLLQSRDSSGRLFLWNLVLSTPRWSRPYLGKHISPPPAAQNRYAAANAASLMGPVAAPCIPALQSCLAGTDSGLRWASVAALGAIGEESCVGLDKVLLNPDPNVRAEVCFVLACLHHLPPEGANLLRSLLLDSAPAVSKALAPALKQMGDAATPALAQFSEQTESVSLQIASMNALVSAGSTRTSVMRILLKNSDSKNDEVRQVALHAVGTLFLWKREARERLLASLTDPQPDIRQDACALLEKMNVNPDEAMPALAALENDPNPQVQSAAAHALQTFRELANRPAAHAY